MIRALGDVGSTQKHLCEADDLSNQEFYVFERLLLYIYLLFHLHIYIQYITISQLKVHRMK
jgi:hypothetical protein